MPICIVSWCPNKTNSSSVNKNLSSLQKLIGGCITYHRFPKNEIKRKKWLDKLNIPELTQKQPLICSVHFNEDAFEKIGNKTFLRKNAEPNSVPIWSMNNDLSEDENEKNFQSWGTTSDSEHSAPISERIIEMEEFEFMDPSLIEVTKIPGLDYKSGRNENKKSESSYESLHKSKFYEFETSNDKFDESLIQNISQTSIMDHDYSISPILENSIPLESKHRSSSMSPERKCCYEKEITFNLHTAATPVAKADLPEVLIIKKKMENESKKNQDIIKNLRLELQKRDEEIAYLRQKLSESDNLMIL